MGTLGEARHALPAILDLGGLPRPLHRLASGRAGAFGDRCHFPWAALRRPRDGTHRAAGLSLRADPRGVPHHYRLPAHPLPRPAPNLSSVSLLPPLLPPL